MKISLISDARGGIQLKVAKIDMVNFSKQVRKLTNSEVKELILEAEIHADVLRKNRSPSSQITLRIDDNEILTSADSNVVLCLEKESYEHIVHQIETIHKGGNVSPEISEISIKNSKKLFNFYLIIEGHHYL